MSSADSDSACVCICVFEKLHIKDGSRKLVHCTLINFLSFFFGGTCLCGVLVNHETK